MYDVYVYGYVFVYLSLHMGLSHAGIATLGVFRVVCTCLYVYAYVHVCVYCMCTYNYWISPIMCIVDGLQSLVGEMSSVLTPYSVPTAQPMVWPNLRSASCFQFNFCMQQDDLDVPVDGFPRVWKSMACVVSDSLPAIKRLNACSIQYLVSSTIYHIAVVKQSSKAPAWRAWMSRRSGYFRKLFHEWRLPKDRRQCLHTVSRRHVSHAARCVAMVLLVAPTISNP